MMISLSIIVPVFNKQEYLSECLQSFERQNFGADVEILLIDDGSTDDSLQICENVAARDKKYRIIHQENQGVAVARNTGIVNAKGQYLAWVDPDDYITDDWYSTVKIELSKAPEMIMFDMFLLEGNMIRPIYYDRRSREISHEELCSKLAKDEIKSYMWSKIIRRDFYQEQIPVKYVVREDYYLMHRLCWNVKNCKYLRKPIYVYRQSIDSITHDKVNQLKNRVISIGLSKQRYNFYKRHGVNVSRLGIYLDMWNYCIDYKRSRQAKSVYYKKLYSICFTEIRKNFVYMLFLKKDSLLNKIKMCCLMIYLLL